MFAAQQEIGQLLNLKFNMYISFIKYYYLNIYFIYIRSYLNPDPCEIPGKFRWFCTNYLIFVEIPKLRKILNSRDKNPESQKIPEPGDENLEWKNSQKSPIHIPIPISEILEYLI